MRCDFREAINLLIIGMPLKDPVGGKSTIHTKINITRFHYNKDHWHLTGVHRVLLVSSHGDIKSISVGKFGEPDNVLILISTVN